MYFIVGCRWEFSKYFIGFFVVCRIVGGGSRRRKYHSSEVDGRIAVHRQFCLLSPCARR